VGRVSRRGGIRRGEGFDAVRFEDVGEEGRKGDGRRGEMRRERTDRDKEGRGGRRLSDAAKVSTRELEGGVLWVSYTG